MAGTSEILVLCGSLRANSSTYMALEEAAAGARGAEATVVWADPWMAALPPYSEENEDHPAVQEFRRAAERADGFLWGSPEYHGSCSGVLKNALDYLYFPQTEGKVVALVATAGGAGGASGTLITLRTVARNLHLWTLPTQVSACSADFPVAVQAGGTGSDVQARLRDLGRALVEAIHLLRPGAPGR